MNTMLPPSRDLPPGRHVEIRAELARTVERRSRRWVLPLVTATAALVVIALAAWLVPWDRGSVAPADGPPPPTPTTSPPPGVPGLTAAQAQEIADGCGQSTQDPGEYTTYQWIVDEGGKFALVYSDKYALACTVDGALMKYNSAFGGYRGAPKPIVVDHAGSQAGGDFPGGKAEYAGEHGIDLVAGRIAPEVAKVVYIQGTEEKDAVIANGTFVARIIRPTDWLIPQNRPAPVVRAYDKNGVLLGEA